VPQQFDQFADQSHRLLRQEWPTATGLAQEIYAMLLAPEGEPAPEQVQVPEAVQDRLRKAQDRITPNAV
jgi:hypothetical protein